jgi:hypothetical protein
MGFENSPLEQLGEVIPDGTETPEIPEHLTDIVTAVEKRLLLKFSSRPARNLKLPAPEDGQSTYIEDVDEIDTRVNGAWVKTWPLFYFGTAAPSGTPGPNDVYFRLEA